MKIGLSSSGILNEYGSFISGDPGSPHEIGSAGLSLEGTNSSRGVMNRAIRMVYRRWIERLIW